MARPKVDPGDENGRATSHPRFGGRPEATDWEDARNRLNLLEVIGRITITLVPAPGWLHRANEPSSCATRSRMPVIPKWSCALKVASSTMKPHPSSWISRRKCMAENDKKTWILHASAWATALRIASLAIRSKLRLTSSGRSGGSPSILTSTGRFTS